MDIASLQTAVQGYYQKGLAKSTHKSYQAGQNRYLTFCREVGKSAVPTTEDILLLFIAHLDQQGLTHATIKVYLSAVRNLHVTVGLHKEFTQQLTPRLEMVLRGMKREKLPVLDSQSRLILRPRLKRHSVGNLKNMIP